MLSNEYYVKLDAASRKFSGASYRYRTVREMLDGYDNYAFDVIDSSHILLDAARLMDLSNRKVDHSWKFTDLKTLQLNELKTDDKQAMVIIEKLKASIEDFRQNQLFTDFFSFKEFWLKQTFADAGDFLKKFYRFVPYVKLGVDDEIDLQVSKESLQYALAKQAVVIDRVQQVILRNAPTDLPEFVRDSLSDYAVRVNDENIPIRSGQ